MDKNQKKNDTDKSLTEIQIRVQLMELLAFMESVISFERTNGRKPTSDERKNLAKTFHISLDGFCALLKNIPSDDIRRAIGSA